MSIIRVMSIEQGKGYVDLRVMSIADMSIEQGKGYVDWAG